MSTEQVTEQQCQEGFQASVVNIMWSRGYNHSQEERKQFWQYELRSRFGYTWDMISELENEAKQSVITERNRMAGERQ